MSTSQLRDQQPGCKHFSRRCPDFGHALAPNGFAARLPAG